ncbi:hypothetical protein SAMN02745781_04171, partial [Vibrio gazogenes DSM 21264]
MVYGGGLVYGGHTPIEAQVKVWELTRTHALNLLGMVGVMGTHTQITLSISVKFC